MLFNSYFFVLIFLPIALLGFFIIGNLKLNNLAKAWLVLSSLFFYGWWNPAYVWLLIFSTLFNYFIGFFVINLEKKEIKKFWLVLGIIGNLGALAYFKYANFFIDNAGYMLNMSFNFRKVILPLGISFFTFEQIAYLVDAYSPDIPRYNLLDYSLFVTFFPRLIAGPIIRHIEVLPQIRKRFFGLFRYKNLSVGLTIFVIGLFKKVIIANYMAKPADALFNTVSYHQPSFAVTLIGVLAYSLQLYFDFSGYSDMAIGLELFCQ